MPQAKNNVLNYAPIREEAAAKEKGSTQTHSTRLRLGRYFADIVPDHDGVALIFHWIIQRVGSSEILALGQETSFSRALEQAHWHLENLAKRRADREKRRVVFYEFGDLKNVR